VYPEISIDETVSPEDAQKLWYVHYPAFRSAPQLQGAALGYQGQRVGSEEERITSVSIPDNSYPYGGPGLAGLYPSSNGRWMVVDVTHWAPQLIDLESDSSDTTVSDVVGDNWHFITWHPDGQQMLVSSEEGFQLVNLAARESTAVEFSNLDPEGSTVKMAKYSPDGTQLADITVYAPVYGGRDTWLLEVGLQDDGVNRVPIAQIENSGSIRYQSMQWSPDGNRLIFITNIQGDTLSGDQLWMLDITTNELDKLSDLTESGCYTTPAVWLPNGELIAAIKVSCDVDGHIDSNIFLIESSTGESRQITQFEYQQISNLNLSPEGSLLAFNISMGDYGEIWVTNLDGSQMYPIAGPTMGNTPFVWLP
jgi:Tol biopolymer transport system component